MVSSAAQTHKKVLEYNNTLGIVAMEGRGFEYPTDTVIAKDGRLYVTNRSRDTGERAVRVTVLDVESEFYGTFGYFGRGDGELVSPMCAAEDNTGHIFVTDDVTHKVTAFGYDGNFVSKWGVHGSEKGELNGPSGIAFDADNNVYITDTHNHRIQKFTSTGEFIMAFGSNGSGQGQFELPWGTTVSPDGEVYVADWGNDRIQKFTAGGDFIAAYGASGLGDEKLQRPSSVAVDERGYMYVADWGNERVKVLDADGGMLQNLRGEATLSKWAALYLEVNREEGEARAKSDLEPSTDLLDADDPHTQSAHVEKLFWAPMSVKLDNAGRLFVTEGNRHRIQIYERTS